MWHRPPAVSDSAILWFPLFRSPDVPITRSPDLFAALCLRPSARNPTPHSALLKTKAKVQFERPVKRLSRPFFLVFQNSNRSQFQPCFPVFAVRSAEGRKHLRLDMQLPAWLIAKPLGASSFFVKDHPPGHTSPGGQCETLPFVRPYVK